jgi:transmembrane sensor
MTDPIALNDEAAAWVVRLNSDQRTRADLDAFQAWLDQGEAQRRAYADHASLWAGLGLLADSEAAHAILLPGGRRRAVGRRAVMFGGLGAVAATLAAVAAAPLLAVQRYRTQPGEQRRIALSDGSRVLLNTDSELRVSLGRSQRRLFLDRGQAYFEVAKDRSRPFRVFVGGDEVRALGTAFDVRRSGEGARVTLEEGRVAIYRARPLAASAALAEAESAVRRAPEAAARPVALLEPGQQAVLVPVSAPVIAAVDLRKSQAWRVGRLVLEDSSLAEAAAELNRYGAPRIVLADPQVSALRLSGVFHTGESAAFVESVTAAFPVRVVRQDADEIVLAHRG